MTQSMQYAFVATTAWQPCPQTSYVHVQGPDGSLSAATVVCDGQAAMYPYMWANAPQVVSPNAAQVLCDGEGGMFQYVGLQPQAPSSYHILCESQLGLDMNAASNPEEPNTWQNGDGTLPQVTMDKSFESPARRRRNRRGHGKGRLSEAGSFSPLSTASTQAGSLSPLSTPEPDAEPQPDAEQEKGDYSKLTAQLESGLPAELKQAAELLKGSMLQLSFHKHGCRVVQLALAKLKQTDAAELVQELSGHVLEAVSSEHANFVLQKIVEQLPTAMFGFIAAELLWSAAAVARHRYGCRVVQRLVEHSSPSIEGKTVTTSIEGKAVIDSVMLQVEDLSQTVYGHFVVTSLLDHGTDAQKCQIGDIVCSKFEVLRQSRHAREVILKALEVCSLEHRRTITLKIFHKHPQLLLLAQSKSGGYLINSALRVDVGDAWAQRRCAQLAAIAPELRAYVASGGKHGKYVLTEIENLLRRGQ